LYSVLLKFKMWNVDGKVNDLKYENSSHDSLFSRVNKEPLS
jgi:hypothetical protein